MGFGELKHFFDAFGEKKIVGANDFAILGFRGDETEGDIVILHHPDKLLVRVDPDAGILFGVIPGNFQGSILAAIINDDVFEPGISLPENTLDAFGQEVRAVINRSDHADQGL